MGRSTFLVQFLLVAAVPVTLPVATATVVEVGGGMLRIEANPSEGSGAQGWDVTGVKGNVSSNQAPAELDVDAFCGTNLGPPDEDPRYPWDGVWCAGYLTGGVADTAVTAIGACAGVMPEPNYDGPNTAICFAILDPGREEGYNDAIAVAPIVHADEEESCVYLYLIVEETLMIPPELVCVRP